MSTGACPSYAKRAGTSKGSCCPMAVGFALKEMYNNFNDMFHFEIKDKKIKTIAKIIKEENNIAKCPECGELLLKKNTKNGVFEVCSSRTCSYKKEMTTEENSDGATE